MFAKKNRISALEVQKMFSSDVKTAHSEFFLLKKRSNDLGLSRFAVLIPKKVSKTAVQRHFDKRMVVSAIQKVNYPVSYDYVLTLKKSIKESSLDAITADLVRILI